MVRWTVGRTGPSVGDQGINKKYDPESCTKRTTFRVQKFTEPASVYPGSYWSGLGIMKSRTRLARSAQPAENWRIVRTVGPKESNSGTFMPSGS